MMILLLKVMFSHRLWVPWMVALEGLGSDDVGHPKCETWLYLARSSELICGCGFGAFSQY